MAVSPSSATNSPNKDKETTTTSKKSCLSLTKKPTDSAKRTKNPGVRIVGGRIYDSEHGKTCHQCRQKTRDFVAPCKGTRRNKPCTINYCHKCLLNRYGEKAEEMAKLEDWSCPRCRGVCNCSFCMKKIGQKPTGMLIHTAKATGFSSVSELLHHKGSEVMNAQDVGLVASKRSRESLAAGMDEKKELFAKKEKRIRLKKQKRESGGGGDTLKCRSRDTKEEKENFEGKISNDAPIGIGITKKGHLLDGNKRKMSVAANSGKSEARPLKLRKRDKLVTVNVLESGDGAAKKDKDNLLGKASEVDNIKDESLALDGCERKGSVNENAFIAKAEPLLKVCKRRKVDTRSLGVPKSQDVVLPQGTPLTMVAGAELPDDDVGPALQFLEFCNAFSKVLDIKKGQAENILRELARGRIGRRGISPSLVHFHIKLLSVIRKDMGEKSISYSPSSGNSWLQALGKCISESQYALEGLPLDCFNRNSSRYDSLDPSTKLRILNFLCDESLGTEKLRSWIDRENMKFVEKNNEVNEKVVAAKRKEKDLKQKLKDDVAKAMLSLRDGALLSVSDHDNLIKKIRIETEKAHAEMLESVSLLPKNKQRPDAVRTQPMLLKGSRHAYWKLRGYCNGSNILFQDFENWDSSIVRDKWFIYDEDDEKVVENHISSLRWQWSWELVRD